ncbi:MAG: DNA repair protein RecN [Burkholderiales bacterium]|nr:DNA repair protein RecN [Burkholderiales bacterium]
MLLNLQVKNFLLIDELELDFYNGLTVITGETGSGKSIIIDALMIIFGAKTNSDVIRTGQSSASFTATFDVNNSDILAWLQEKEFLDNSDENTIICRRVIDPNGRSKAYINSTPTTLGVIKELGEMLLDIHTQHASIALLKADNQRALLDDFAHINDKVTLLQEYYKQINSLTEKLQNARQFSQDIIIRQEILQEKISDVNNLSLQEDEWDNLQVEQKQLANASLILQELDFSISALDNEHYSMYDTISTISSKLNKIQDYLPTYKQISALVESIDNELSELDRELQNAAGSIEQNPDQLAIIDARIDEIYSLSRKYRIRPEDISEQLVIWQNDLKNINTTLDLDALESELSKLSEVYTNLANDVSNIRRQTAEKLSFSVTELLHTLAISGEFKVQMDRLTKPSATGIDAISYQVCFNKGMQLQALNKVASGGELSRVALALYVILSINNPPEIIIFDEIDVGIGGGVAQVVGQLLNNLGLAKQVICITHQPQTASCGNNHLLVSKSTLNNSTTTSRIDYVNNENRVNEIARMLGGLQITDTTLQHAREMLNTQHSL